MPTHTPHRENRLHSRRRRPARGGSTADSTTLDALFGVLADSRRRHVLAVLDVNDAAVPLMELAAQVAARETGSPPVELGISAVEPVTASLVHVHLPRLADAGLVDWDRDRKAVTSRQPSEAHRPLVSKAIDLTE